MSSPNAPSSALGDSLKNLLRPLDLDSVPFELVPLSGGANNQVYRVAFENRPSLVLKHYFFSPEDRRDRFHAEKSFYDFIGAAVLRDSTPQALAWDRERRLGLFSWIEGRRLAVTEVTRAVVDQALAFYFALNKHRHLPEASAISNASEACFDLKQHFDSVERRMARLKTIDPNSILGGEALDFIGRQLTPAFDHYQRLQTPPKSTETTALTESQRCLSPSDFGFHNSLAQINGNLVFFDFEYAGWDDPAKFLCDFLCQPAVPIPGSLWSHCIDSLCQPIPGGTERERIARLLPLYHLKWCCILLNEFLPQEQNRRAFSQKHSPPAQEAKRREQLGKARNLLETVSGGGLLRQLES